MLCLQDVSVPPKHSTVDSSIQFGQGVCHCLDAVTRKIVGWCTYVCMCASCIKFNMCVSTRACVCVCVRAIRTNLPIICQVFPVCGEGVEEPTIFWFCWFCFPHTQTHETPADTLSQETSFVLACVCMFVGWLMYCYLYVCVFVCSCLLVVFCVFQGT